MTHIILVEDDPAIASALSYRLQQEGWQCTWVTTKIEALNCLSTVPIVSAMILDVGLPDGTGFELCSAIRHGTHHATVPIVFLTAKDDEIDTVMGLEMGADDYITKPFSPREVIARIKAVWRRQKMHTPADLLSQSMLPSPSNTAQGVLTNTGLLTTPIHKTLPTGTWRYDVNQYQLYLDEVALPLSKTELSLMLVLLANPNHILSREQLLAAISDHPEHRLVRTIDAHIKSLRHKLSEVCKMEIIVTHRGLGYVLAT